MSCPHGAPARTSVQAFALVRASAAGVDPGETEDLHDDEAEEDEGDHEHRVLVADLLACEDGEDSAEEVRGNQQPRPANEGPRQLARRCRRRRWAAVLAHCSSCGLADAD